MRINKSKFETMRDNNSKYLCLNCLSLSDKEGECCDLVKIRVTNKVVSKKLGKALHNIDWSSFIKNFSLNVDDSTKKIQILEYIANNYVLTYHEYRRCQKNLELLSQKKLSETVTIETIKPISEFFYIDKNERIFILDCSKTDDNNFLKDLFTTLNINTLIKRRLKTYKNDVNKTYYVALICCSENNLYYFPSSSERYMIYEGKCYFSYCTCGNKIIKNCYIDVVVNDSIHTFSLDDYRYYNHNLFFKDKIQQEILLFETEKEASEFQKKYTNMIFDCFKTKVV